jgi:hypothetical protein
MKLVGFRETMLRRFRMQLLLLLLLLQFQNQFQLQLQLLKRLNRCQLPPSQLPPRPVEAVAVDMGVEAVAAVAAEPEALEALEALEAELLEVLEVLEVLEAEAEAVEAMQAVRQANPAPSVIKPSLAPSSLRVLTNIMPTALVVLLATPILQARLTSKRRTRYGVRNAILLPARKNVVIVVRRLQALIFKP